MWRYRNILELFHTIQLFTAKKIVPKNHIYPKFKNKSDVLSTLVEYPASLKQFLWYKDFNLILRCFIALMPKLFSILPEVHPVNPWPSPSVWTSGHPRQTPSSRSCDRDLWKSGKAGDPLVRKIQRSDPVFAIEDPDSSGSFWTCLANCNFGDLNESVLLLIYTPGMFLFDSI